MSIAADAHELARAGPMSVAPGYAAAESPGMDPAEVWRIIKQRKGLVILSFVLLYLLVGATTFVVYKWFPAYPAEALLELAPPRIEVLDVENPLVDPDMMELQLETEAAKLKQLSLLQDVLKLPEIKNTAFVQWYGGDLQECLFDLQDMISSSPVKDTHLISVRFSCAKPEESKLIVDKIVSRYWERYVRSQTDQLAARLEDLKSSQSAMRGELDAKRTDIRTFRENKDVPALRSDRTILEENIAFLTQSISELKVQAADYQTQLDMVQGMSPGDLPLTPEMQIIIEADPLLRFYRNQVETLDIEIQAARKSVMGDEHRQMKVLRDRRAGYAAKENSKREELMDLLRRRQVETYIENLQRTRSMQARLQEELELAAGEQRDLSRNIQQFIELVSDEERLTEQLLQIELAVGQAKHAVLGSSRGRLQVVQLPVKAVEPSRPNLPLFLGGGFVLALLGSVGLAFLREFTDKAIRTPIDVTRYGRVSVLGSIPLLDDEEADVDEIEMATRLAPQSLVAEAFRQVRANLFFSGPVESQRSLLVTSPGPGDGKTAVAINLAVTIAQGNQRVLLVDCNFRRPGIRGAFRGTRPEGLSNVLIGQAKLQDVITKTELDNLDVVTSGPTPPTPAELLGSNYMRDVIKEATEKYDRVIFDAPPVLLISDTLILATQVDGVILVARAVGNTKGALKRAREQFDRVNARVVGAVLNGAEARAGGYFKQQYAAFYDYTADETVPAELPGVAAERPADSQGTADRDDQHDRDDQD